METMHNVKATNSEYQTDMTTHAKTIYRAKKALQKSKCGLLNNSERLRRIKVKIGQDIAPCVTDHFAIVDQITGDVAIFSRRTNKISSAHA